MLQPANSTRRGRYSSPVKQPVPTLVVVPAFNEADTVGEVVRRVEAVGYPTLVVDDGSTDGTSEIAARAGATVITM
ncbi:MAG: glycosyltransferase, partial [Actinomycetota bacterium]|nr:glycosyltransferase [Actinomycetota bacterium]